MSIEHPAGLTIPLPGDAHNPRNCTDPFPKVIEQKCLSDLPAIRILRTSLDPCQYANVPPPHDLTPLLLP